MRPMTTILRLLTVSQVAAKLAVSRQQVEKWLHAGRMACVEVGGRRLVEPRHARKPKRLPPGRKSAQKLADFPGVARK